MGDWGKFHSAIRWGKPIAELEPLAKDASVVNAKDDKNGNQAIHLSSQNGHFEITKWLVEKGADVNGQNGKGQTALHMSVAYDFYDQTKFLLAKGAKEDIKNGDGNAAITGIEGDKVGPEAWDSPVNMLKSVATKEAMEAAFAAIGGASADQIDKAVLVQTGMKKKKEHTAFWDQTAFMALVAKF